MLAFFFFFLKKYLFVCMYVCVNLYTLHILGCYWRPEEGIRYPETGVSCGCELSDVGAGD